MTYLTKLFCRHKRLSWVKNIHLGDKRTVFHCDDCQKFIHHSDYVTKAMAIFIYVDPSEETT